MPQVASTAAAAHLNADHAVADVAHPLHQLGVGGRVKAGPTATGVELGAGLEQQGAATDAVVIAIDPVIPIGSSEGALGGGLARHLVLHGIKFGAPLRVGFLHGVVGHGAGIHGFATKVRNEG